MKSEHEKLAWEMLKQSLGPYHWTHLDMLRSFLFGVFLTALFLLPVYVLADDNEITILQEGDNFDLNITQTGYSNIIKQWSSTEGIDGADNTIAIAQNKNYGSSTDKNIIEIRRVWGIGNDLKLAQGYIINGDGSFSIDNDEYGDTFVHVNVTGDYNDIEMTQRTNNTSSGHWYGLHIEGDYNDISTIQREGGGHTLDLDIFNDNNAIDVVQKNSGSHYAWIRLDGTYGTDITLLQDSTLNKSYSLNQVCYTVGGCSVSVTQQ